MKELDDRWRADQPAEQAQAIQQLYDGRKNALDAIVADMLIEQAAKAKGMNADAVHEAEVARRVKPVTDGQIAAFFQQNQAQMQGRGLDAMSPAIRRYLEEQQRAQRVPGAGGRAAQGRAPRCDVVIDAPRYTVERRADDPVLGSANAPVTLVEFSDFQCPFCQRVMPTLKKVRETYGDRVRIVWKDFPLTSIHPQAFKAAEAGQCAREQGKFWEYHDRLFANQQALAAGRPQEVRGRQSGSTREVQRVPRYVEVRRARAGSRWASATQLGVSSTPTLFINGRMVSGAQPYEVVCRDHRRRARAGQEVARSRAVRCIEPDDP